MKKHGFQKIILGVLAALCLVVTAGAAQGGEDDPLVTLGYLTEQFLPKVLDEVEVKMTERDKTLESKLEAMVNTYSNDMEKKLRKLSSTSGETAAAPFVTVTLSAGQKLTLSAGGELLFRGGSAKCAAPSSPGLVDMTAGTILENGSTPEVNHLYLATDGSRGLTAAGTVTVLVRGEYTVS